MCNYPHKMTLNSIFCFLLSAFCIPYSVSTHYLIWPRLPFFQKRASPLKLSPFNFFNSTLRVIAVALVVIKMTFKCSHATHQCFFGESHLNAETAVIYSYMRQRLIFCCRNMILMTPHAAIGDGVCWVCCSCCWFFATKVAA